MRTNCCEWMLGGGSLLGKGAWETYLLQSYLNDSCTKNHTGDLGETSGCFKEKGSRIAVLGVKNELTAKEITRRYLQAP